MLGEEKSQYRLSDFLPTTKKEMKLRGWEELDVVLISGDAYVDHPSFGVAVIGRLLESLGLRVGIIPQPNWRDDGHEFQKFGAPRLFFGVSGGNMDPMVNHYTAGRRRRSDDAFTPGGEPNARPDHATEVYTQWLKRLYPDVPVLIGGIEASLRRLTHYDYWEDTLRESILKKSGADILVYGMGEQPMTEIVNLLKKGVPFSSLKTVPQTAFLLHQGESLPKNKRWEDLTLPSFEQCGKDKKAFAGASRHIEEESNKRHAMRLLQAVGSDTVVVNPPFPTMTTEQIDASYDMPYTRLPHPRYKDRPVIPAYTMIRHSVNIHRGCFGGCAFCTISAHQGKFIASRSERSIIEEMEKITRMPDFTGTITDLGGPSANMYRMGGRDTSLCDKCARPSCISPAVCPNLDTSHKALRELYAKARKVNGVKHIFIGSGIRYDLLVPEFNKKADPKDLETYLDDVVKHHVSGRLKVAPEHSSDDVLKIMRKPSFKYFRIFKQTFDRLTTRAGKKQTVIPYFISSHPGSHLQDMAQLAVDTKELDFKLEQVQDFTPTPMTISTDIYYSGVHPYTGEDVFTAKNANEKKDQNIFFFWYKAENRNRISSLLRGFDVLRKKLLGR
ncbi:MAG: YgiQ family radical SAM protein [Flavobacteriales bacterium]|nr:YgiQ family radical SAM protein [Flavobacteriales bacterium]